MDEARGSRARVAAVLWLLVSSVVLSTIIALQEIARLVDVAAEPIDESGRLFSVSSLTQFWGGQDRVTTLTSTWLFSDALSQAPTWIGAYLLIDLVFIVGYALLLWKVLRLVGSPVWFAWMVAACVAALDMAETAWPLARACVWDAPAFSCTGAMSDGEAWVLVVLSTLKWVALGIAAMLVVALWWSGRTEGSLSRQGASAATQRTRRGSEQPLWQALIPAWVVVGLFVLLVAVPGSGPLTQLPDVLRAQIEGSVIADGGDWLGSVYVLVPSSVALVVLVLSVVVSAGWATWRWTQADGTVAYWRPLAFAALASGLMVAGGFVVDGGPNWSSAAPFAVFAVIAAAGALVGWLRDRVLGPSTEDEEPNGGSAVAPANSLAWSQRRPGWIGVLAGVVVAAGGLGLQRATLTPVLVGVDTSVVLLPSYAVWLVAAAMVTTLGACLAFLVVAALVRAGASGVGDDASGWWVAGHVVVAALVVAGAAWLAVTPQSARVVGTTGSIAVGLSAIVLLTGGLMWLSRSSGVWRPIRELGVGARSPWLLVLIAVWLAADAWQPDGYHDVRTTQVAAAPEQTLGERLAQVVDAAAGNTACVTGDGQQARVPLVLLAAPGGGIRAAYWTGVVLDGMFPDPACAPSLVAVSGVSGGSVGLAARLLIDPSGSSQDALATMSADTALAANVAGLLLRDLPRPLTGAVTPWVDRAVIHETSWVDGKDAPFAATDGDPASCDPGAVAGDGASAASVLYPVGEVGCAWRDADEGGRTDPVVMLNAASVNDGCRLVSANLDGLSVTTPSLDCLGEPSRDGGPLSVTHDATNRLVPWSRADDEPLAGSTSLPAVTGALMSARYPLVSPVGSLLQDSRRLYATDGGLYENTGLLSLLELWEVLEPVVAERNRQALADGVSPATPIVEPWVVMAASGSASALVDREPQRPGQIGGPLQALVNRASAAPLSTAGLSQVASVAMSGPIPGTTLNAGTRFVVLAPSADQSITAPLGWVLAPSTQRSLDGEAAKLLGETVAVQDPVVARLRALLTID